MLDAHLFLATQDWLSQVERQSGVVSGSNKRSKQTPFRCQTSFHISLAEQYSCQECQGAKARDAVFIRLQLPGGVVSSTMDASVTVIEQEDGRSCLAVEWFPSQSGTIYTINSSNLSKVVCSPAIFASCTAQHTCLQQLYGTCLLAHAAAVDCQGLDFISLITPHVCLDLFAQRTDESVEGLSRVASFLHQQAPCSQAPQPRPTPHGGNSSTSSSMAAAWTPPTGAAEVSQWLSGAACEAKMLQLLIDGSSNRDQAQQQHLLQALVRS